MKLRIETRERIKRIESDITCYVIPAIEKSIADMDEDCCLKESLQAGRACGEARSLAEELRKLLE